MICPNCEKTIKDGIAQCPHCGCHFPVKENKEEVTNKQKETIVVPPIIETNPTKEEKQENTTPIVPPVVESKPVIEEKSEKEAPPQIEENVSQKTDFKFCRNCGKKISSTAIFCKYCGKQVTK